MHPNRFPNPDSACQNHHHTAVPRASRIATGLNVIHQRLYVLFEALPPDALRIDFRPTFLTWNRKDRKLTGDPAILYELAYLIRQARLTPDTALDRLLAVRWPGADPSRYADRSAYGPEGKKRPLKNFRHAFNPGTQDLIAVPDSVRPHLLHTVNWHTGAQRIARTLHFHDLNAFCHWLKQHLSAWNTESHEIFTNPGAWLPKTSGGPVTPALILDRLQDAALQLQRPAKPASTRQLKSS